MSLDDLQECQREIQRKVERWRKTSCRKKLGMSLAHLWKIRKFKRRKKSEGEEGWIIEQRGRWVWIIYGKIGIFQGRWRGESEGRRIVEQGEGWVWIINRKIGRIFKGRWRDEQIWVIQQRGRWVWIIYGKVRRIFTLRWRDGERWIIEQSDDWVWIIYGKIRIFKGRWTGESKGRLHCWRERRMSLDHLRDSQKNIRVKVERWR